MPRVLGITVPRRVLNLAVTPLAWAGVAPFDIHLLTVRGRRTGRRHTTPVTVLRHAGERWLVAPYGERNWVRNARAAGVVELRRGRLRERVSVEEVVGAGERAPVLRAYLERNRSTADLFDAGRGAPVAEFAAEADRHPVFRLSRCDCEGGGRFAAPAARAG
jgi:deazaflavin-dependent oxidoreductase (nitroreductase family)